MTQVAIGLDFLKAFSDIPRAQQKKVREFVDRFRENPAQPGTNYEPIKSARDKNLYSARIDQAYRAVVLHPSGTELYVLAWVDQHDRAYQWAESRTFKVNAATGALQVVPVEMPAVEPAARPTAVSTPGLFRHIEDTVLLRLGVPQELLPTVRTVTTDSELDAVAPAFPQEASEALYYLAAGYSPDEVFAELDKKAADTRHDPTDFEAALANEDSRRRFVVVASAAELTELLNAPLEVWRVFLHPKQRHLVTIDAAGPVRVLGGAGTGKTVVAMHRAKFLAEEVFKAPSDRVLLTTFTRNLATDIHANLRKICSTDALARIEVVNLDAFVANFLKARGYPHTPVFGEEENEFWDNAVNVAPPELGLSREFLRAEWEQVIQAQDVQTLDAYLRAPRLGRGTRLPREQRAKAWVVFEEYREQLRSHSRREFVDLIRDARQLVERQRPSLPYRAAVVDEAQDMSPEAFRLLRAVVPPGRNDLFIVGDAHQRIYRYRASLGTCGIDIRGRGRKLRLNYRTTEEIRRFAVGLLEGRTIDDLDAGRDEQKGYVSLTHGIVPSVRVSATLTQGLEFDHVIIVGASQGVLPLDRALAAAGDALEAADLETQERALLYVALTRARKSALITAHGSPSPFLRSLTP